MELPTSVVLELERGADLFSRAMGVLLEAANDLKTYLAKPHVLMRPRLFIDGNMWSRCTARTCKTAWPGLALRRVMPLRSSIWR